MEVKFIYARRTEYLVVNMTKTKLENQTESAREGKSRINFWLENEIKNSWDEYRKKSGMNITNLIKTAVHEYIIKNSSPEVKSISKRLEKRLEEIAVSSTDVQSERDARMSQLIRDQEEMKALMQNISTQFTAERTIEGEDKGRVLDLLSGARYDIKKISRVLKLSIPATMAILEDLSKRGLVAQDAENKWGVIHV